MADRYLSDPAHRPAEWFRVLHFGEELDEVKCWRPLKAIRAALRLPYGPFRGQSVEVCGRRLRVVSVAAEGRVRLDDGSLLETAAVPV